MCVCVCVFVWVQRGERGCMHLALGLAGHVIGELLEVLFEQLCIGIVRQRCTRSRCIDFTVVETKGREAAPILVHIAASVVALLVVEISDMDRICHAATPPLRG